MKIALWLAATTLLAGTLSFANEERVITENRYIAGHVKLLMEMQAKGEVKLIKQNWQVGDFTALAIAGYRVTKLTYVSQDQTCFVKVELNRPEDQQDFVIALDANKAPLCIK